MIKKMLNYWKGNKIIIILLIVIGIEMFIYYCMNYKYKFVESFTLQCPQVSVTKTSPTCNKAEFLMCDDNFEKIKEIIESFTPESSSTSTCDLSSSSIQTDLTTIQTDLTAIKAFLGIDVHRPVSTGTGTAELTKENTMAYLSTLKGFLGMDQFPGEGYIYDTTSSQTLLDILNFHSLKTFLVGGSSTKTIFSSTDRLDYVRGLNGYLREEINICTTP